MGACPQSIVAADDRKPLQPPLASLLPSEKAWLIELPAPPSAPASMDDTRVYIPLQGEHFIAIARETGESRWMVDIESDWTPLVHDGVVYIAASDELHALDAATGEHKWRVPLGRGPIAPLALAKDTIVALAAPDEVWAFRPADGHRLWSQSLGGSVGPASMTIDGDRIFVAIGSRLVRVELANGKVKWDRTLPGTLGPPAAAGGRVFVGSTAKLFHALQQDSGSVSWSYPVGGDVVGAAVDDEIVYVASLDNVLRALKQGSGGQTWKSALTTRPVAPPLVLGGIVAVPGILPPLSTFNPKTRMPIGAFDASADLQGVRYLAPLLISPTLSPYAVSIVAITRDGRATGHRPVAMMFRETPLEPFTTLPGRPLAKERPPW